MPLLGKNTLRSLQRCFNGLEDASLLEYVGDVSGCVKGFFEVGLIG
jgi:hypothetical protein